VYVIVIIGWMNSKEFIKIEIYNNAKNIIEKCLELADNIEEKHYIYREKFLQGVVESPALVIIAESDPNYAFAIFNQQLEISKDSVRRLNERIPALDKPEEYEFDLCHP